MKVSVIMSVYNRENYIKSSLESLLCQTFKDFEIIIIDDCSTDKSVEIIESYSDNRIKLIKNKENKGITYNLNRAIELSQGEYIARMDDDDICLPNRLECQVKFLDKHKKVDLVCSQALFFGDKEGPTSLLINNCNYIKNYLCYRNIIVHPSVMFRKSSDIRYDENYIKAQDSEAWFREFVINGKNVAYISKPLLNYRHHSGQTNVSIQNANGLRIIERNYQFLFKEKEQSVFDTHCRLLYFLNDRQPTELEVVEFYNYFRKKVKFSRYVKCILLFEINNRLSKVGLKNPLKKKFLACLLNPLNVRFTFSAIKVFLLNKKHCKKGN